MNGQAESDGMTAQVYVHGAQLFVPWGRIGAWLTRRLLQGLDFTVHIYTETTGWQTLQVLVGSGQLRFIKEGDEHARR